MNDNERLQKHKKLKKTLKIVGISLLAVGLICVIIAAVDFFKSVSAEKQPTLFWLFGLGFPVTSLGFISLIFGFQREIHSYTANEAAPVINQMATDVKPAVKSVTQAANSVVCPSCGENNDKDAKFCKKCCTQLVQTCPHCGESVDASSTFCDNCGAKLK